MSFRVSFCQLALAVSLIVALVLLAPSLGARELEPPVERVVFVGFVVAPDGAPAEGAVVVTSAGGSVVSDDLGAFRLAVEVPLAADRVRVTAVGESEQVASLDVAVGAGGTVLVGALQLAEAATCSPSWLPTFGELQGLSNSAVTMAVFDDGSGPALYAGGGFDVAGGVPANLIASWDGSAWSSVGGGVTLGGGVLAMTVFDDGGGEALIVGGQFTSVGGVSVESIASWDGSTWSALGTPGGLACKDLAVFDDGGGEALYACGVFTGGDEVRKWDGSGWSTVGTVLGTSGGPKALTVFDDGGGESLYVGGGFTSVDGVPASRIAAWDGSQWSALGSGIGARGVVQCLETYDDGTGEALYAGGRFAMAGAVSANHIARWDGTTWTGLSTGMNDEVLSLIAYQDGVQKLFVGGKFTSAGGVGAARVARWDGSVWGGLGGVNSTAQSFAVYDGGGGPELIVSGSFTTAAAVTVSRIARWKGGQGGGGSAWWSSLGGGGLQSYVNSLAEFDDGTGPALFVGGSFTGVDGITSPGVAKWDGSTWSALGSGISGIVSCLAVYDDGNGEALYVGGLFTDAGGVPADNLARWDGTQWTPVGGGADDHVFALVAYDDGGEKLFAGGQFLSAGGVGAARIARWDGTSWDGLGGVNSRVFALAVHDSGSGPELIVGGQFTTAGPIAVSRVARWKGGQGGGGSAWWTDMGGGTGVGSVDAFHAYDSGGGAQLYVGGSFLTAGGAPASNIAAWDGANWSSVGGGANQRVECLGSLDSGAGLLLYAGGSFTTAGGISASRIASWDGSSWAPVGSGTNTTVVVLETYDDGFGTDLFVGGAFTTAYDSLDAYLARWGCPYSPRITSYCTAGSSASGCQALLSATGTPSATAASGFDLHATGGEGLKDGLYFFGTNGRQANPWGSGTSYQCVIPPVKRAGLLVGTGTVGACNGAFSQDLNARWSAKPAQNPGPGAVVQAQLWYRDPFNTSNQTTSLSDAIEFTVGP